MGFHKRYIDDEQVIRLYQNGGVDDVIKWYTKGSDAIITSGVLAEEVGLLINIVKIDRQIAQRRISETIEKMIFI